MHSFVYLDMHPTSGHNFTQRLGDLSFDMIWVEGGEFWMGADEDDTGAYLEERPRHPVQVSDFWIGKYPVTQAIWKEVMEVNPSNFPGLTRPVESISWNDCKAFLKKLEAITDKPYRLTTEAEWEYAARGGKHSEGYRHAGSDKLTEVGWFNGNSGSQTQPVGLKLPNELGIFDLCGNVFEWCEDWFNRMEYHETDAEQGLRKDPVGPKQGLTKAIRGGSWFDYPDECRISFRYDFVQNSPYYTIGLRLVMSRMD